MTVLYLGALAAMGRVLGRGLQRTLAGRRGCAECQAMAGCGGIMARHGFDSDSHGPTILRHVAFLRTKRLLPHQRY
jgi:hypothetical protein